ncbi:related to ethionine resistance protein [Cephalotrichum gorgonifer]|uniref:Related to ethionine resistance protein n=1 Tax=Cephalotrichum gorgonifer TaxID=2041049 RepID=A0AAE8MUG8_9PEZI|nr:related to ethionine resistance protein [Cephalotrichum gorgonifer]
MYRRPSGVAYGTARPTVNDLTADAAILSATERAQRVFGGGERKGGGDGGAKPARGEPGETSPLLAGGAGLDDEEINQQWNEAVAAGRVRTSWGREVKTIGSYSAPLVVAFLLQYSINVVSIFAVGRIGKMELGAVSLASMTAVITCYAPLQGLTTSLDTLCAQAYGSGHRHLVGLQLQRMVLLLLLCYLPIAVVWWNGEAILARVVPDPRSAELAGSYLRVLIVGGPFISVFEAAKRFVQAQGLFHATTWVLLIAAPANMFVSWLLVWKLEFGFIGAPISVVFTQILMPVLLFLYVRFVDGYQCWGGFSRRALSNWGVMVRLAIPGMIMIEAEYLAFEILTLASARFGPSSLAAQSILATLASISYQLPFALSIAASTRIANLIGAGLVDAAIVSTKVTISLDVILGLFNATVMWTLRHVLVGFFTDDEEVAQLATDVMAIVAVMQWWDAVSTGAHGVLRGIGQQHIGGYANLAGHYLFAMPLAFGTGFGLGWELKGLWVGIASGVAVVAIVEYAYAYIADWNRAAREARDRNEAD